MAAFARRCTPKLPVAAAAVAVKMNRRRVAVIGAGRLGDSGVGCASRDISSSECKLVAQECKLSLFAATLEPAMICQTGRLDNGDCPRVGSVGRAAGMA